MSDTERLCNTTLAHMRDAAAASDRGLVCAPVDAQGRSRLQESSKHSWAQIHQAARVMAGRLQAAGLAPREAVAVLAGSPVDVASLVQAIWMCGASVTMAHHPTHRSDPAAWVADTASVLEGIGASRLVVGAPFEPAFTQFESALGRRCIRIDDLRSGPVGREVPTDADATALLQLTSGSTGRPRAVSITFGNLEANIHAITAASETDVERDVTVSWLPLFHDMGMTGFLIYPMYHGMEAVIVTPGDFLADPLLWPVLISRHRGTLTAAPNFAYDLVSRRLHTAAPGAFDLSCLRFALSGGERIDPSTLDRFITAAGRFGMPRTAIVPAYGMAEATLAVSFTRPGESYQVWGTDAERVALGRPLPGCEVRVVSPEGSVLPPKSTGEFHIRGGNVTAGYRTGAGVEPACDAEGWLATGDLGYLTEDGQPVICGRSKDALIVSGRTIIPEDIECRAASVAGVRAGGVAAVRTGAENGHEGFAVVVESRGHADAAEVSRIRAEVVARVFDSLGLSPQRVHVVEPGWIPKTSSGKLRRAETARWLAQRDGGADRPAPAGKGGPPVGVMECWVADIWQALLKIDRPGRLDRFTDLGGDSLAALEFSRMLDERFGITVSVDRFAGRPTIAAIVADLGPGAGERRESVVRLRAEDRGPVYVMVPGYGGHAWAFGSLANVLTGPCDVLALSLMDINADASGELRTAVRSAALAAVRSPAAEGRPIVLVGYSFGGIAATDLACWLGCQGVTVRRLLLLDPHPLDSNSPRVDVARLALDALYRWSPRVHRSLRRWRDRRPAGKVSPAAQKLEDDIYAAHRNLKTAYLDGSVRLPPIPVAWLQTGEMATEHRHAAALFGTPIAQIKPDLIDANHVGLLVGPHVGRLGAWCDRHVLTGDLFSGSTADSATLPPVHLHRNGFDPTPELGEIRATRGIEKVTTAFGATAYLVTRHDDVTAVLADHQRFANTPLWAGRGVDRNGNAGNLLSLDPPQHTRLRQMLTGEFTAHRMKLLEPRVREIVDDHLAAMERAGPSSDLVSSFALPIPSLVICELLGVPYSDRDSFQQRTARQLDVSTAITERMALERESRAYMAELVSAARTKPGDDIVGRLIRNHGAELGEDELAGIVNLLLQAGHETTANMLGLGALALLRHPDQLAVVRDQPEAVGPAIEELLRWLSIVQTSPWARFATTDVEIAAVPIPAGRPVLTSLLAANRDPAVIDRPESLDVRRSSIRHVAFGHGVHYCLGAPMARMELAIALPALLRKFPDLALAEPFETLAFRNSHFIYGLKSLRVTW